MGWGYGPQEPDIVWIKTLDQLEEKWPYQDYYKKSVFGKYHVIDVTHDNKLVTVKASPRTAEERKQRQLQYKKHAKCEIIVKEVDIQSQLSLNLSNVFGTQSCLERISALYNKGNPMIKDNIIVDRGINMKLKVDDIEVDQMIITKTEKQMRLTILNVSDDYGNTTTITLFDNDIVDSFKEGQTNFVQITNAEVNMRMYREGYNKEPMPEGLKIPSWAKIEIASDGFDESKSLTAEIPNEKDGEGDELVRCEQSHCPRVDAKLKRFPNGKSTMAQDNQYFCVKCNMELCNICILDHKTGTSVSNRTCDAQVCKGSRADNGFSEVVKN